MEDLIPFDLPTEKSSIIKVIGVGGGGSNAVSFMFQQGMTDVDFIVCNTDQQALVNSPVPIKLHLGQTLTEGLGAGNKPEKGREAAVENLDDVIKVLENNTKMVFITAGMGGGTGTGAAPVIAKAARELGILTVGIITIPFRFEGKRRIEQAVKGVQEINKYVDSLLVINNERLREIYGDLGVTDAFSRADNVLSVAAKGIAEIITKKGHVNVDFADVKTVMTESGVALFGSAQAEGEGRALHAIQEALNSPLLNNNDITGAQNILLNISFGEEDVTVDEIFEITNFVQDAAGNTADLIWGYNQDTSLGKKINVTVIATGFETDVIPELYASRPAFKRSPKVEDFSLEENILSEEVDFEVNYTNDDLKLISTNSQTFNQNEPVQNEGFGVESQEEEIIVHQQNPQEENTDDEDERVRKALERLAQMEDVKKKMEQKNQKVDRNAKAIDELENIPAYKRRNVDLDLEGDIEDSKVSRYVLNDDDDEDDIELSENSYLHDNVD
ncbi:MAG: cell division protein FtsZ [Bacteroidota bacterium]